MILNLIRIYENMPGHNNQQNKSYPTGKFDFQGSHLYTEIDKIFFSDGYKLAKELLGRIFSYENMLRMSSVLYDEVDSLMDSFSKRCQLEGKQVDCRKGCYVCCFQTVLVLPYEAFYIVSFIQNNLNKNNRDLIFDRIIKKDNATRKMKVQEFLSYKDPCPLLKNGICMVYEARPMACRTYLSSSSDGCKTEYDHPKEMNIFPDLYEFPMRAGRMMNAGISAHLIDNQIPTTEWQIESSLRTALDDMTVFERWLNGENIFQKRIYSAEEIQYLNRFGSGK